MFSSAAQQLVQAARDGRHQHIVDRRAVCSCDLPGPVDIAADDSEPAIGADRSIEAGPRCSLLGEGLVQRRPRVPHVA
jgi:hypothetical protein